jgi:arylformamidase
MKNISFRFLTAIFISAFFFGNAFAQASEKSLNIQYAKRDGSSTNLTNLDIYAPKSAKNAPVMIMIHGGGWQGGDKSNRKLNENKIPFFNQNGFVYVSINYRLSPAIKHPGHIEDVAEAIAWVHEKINKYSGDKDKLFVMGHSSGAHLAALVAIDERRLKVHKKDLSILKGVILLDGAGYNIPFQMKGSDSVGGILGDMYLNAFTNDEKIQIDASPIFQIKKGTKIPPFLIFTAGGRRASVMQSTNLVKALIDAGGKAETINDPSKVHATINSQFGLPEEMITKKSKEFLDRILKKN